MPSIVIHLSRIRCSVTKPSYSTGQRAIGNKSCVSMRATATRIACWQVPGLSREMPFWIQSRVRHLLGNVKERDQLCLSPEAFEGVICAFLACLLLWTWSQNKLCSSTVQVYLSRIRVRTRSKTLVFVTLFDSAERRYSLEHGRWYRGSAPDFALEHTMELLLGNNLQAKVLPVACLVCESQASDEALTNAFPRMVSGIMLLVEAGAWCSALCR